ncbi:MAG: hypothetical protein PHD91_03820 [bacterium]|jgi:hypothetical protein|nr:hypothetical protein [bacterium]MDD3805311.1 hypothetical protein [bacterium]MDD4152825.1 hypothetical protein [bacterium]MDD4558811.1 hypothetical protein [bacterium]
MQEDTSIIRELIRRRYAGAGGELTPAVIRRLRIELLEEMLGDPLPGELPYQKFAAVERLWGEDISRLQALKLLHDEAEAGNIRPAPSRGGINTHVHTSASFSVFRSPGEAAWQAFMNGVMVFGINDHYTIAGHKEFAEACNLLGIKALFSIEALALDEAAQAVGRRFNDPNNPGRIYLSGKGVVKDLKPGSREEALLSGMRQSLERRNRLMVEKVSSILSEADPNIHLDFDDVLLLTPAGNATERHIAQAVETAIEGRFGSESETAAFLSSLADVPEADIPTAGARRQNFIRDRLLKSGRPAFVPESPDAFISLDDMVLLFRGYGAIPAYPVLGNPNTEGESDLRALFEEMKSRGIFAVEVIPNRNDRERLEQIVRAAAAAAMPVFNGTEHNTRDTQPLLDKFALDPEFKGIFARGAAVLLAHQHLSRERGVGYLDANGRPSVDGDPAKTMAHFEEVGRGLII